MDINTMIGKQSWYNGSYLGDCETYVSISDVA